MNEVEFPPSNETPYPDCGPLIHPPCANEGNKPPLDLNRLVNQLPLDLSSPASFEFIVILTFLPKVMSPLKLPSLSNDAFPLSPKSISA